MRDIVEILEHWQAGRSISAISRSLGVCRGTVRKYVYTAEASDTSLLSRGNVSLECTFQAKTVHF